MKITFSHQELAFAKLLSELIACNPFTSRRSEIEREILGSEFQQSEKDWTLSPSQYRTTKNLDAIHQKTETVLHRITSNLKPREQISPKDFDGFLDLANYALFHRNRNHQIPNGPKVLSRPVVPWEKPADHRRPS